MIVIESKREMQREMASLRNNGHRIGFVPTMGYLHEGHLSLLQLARTHADVLVASIYVNPSQFGPNEDLTTYPRDLPRDVCLLESVGCDYVFTPTTSDMYGPDHLTWVEVERITDGMCGATRPGHFRGVATIVTKLFNIVKPHVAVFGQKDAQQAAVIRRITIDLDLDVEIIIGPIVREADGLAMSSRNAYLSPQERAEAVVLHQALQLAKQRIEAGERAITPLVTEMKTLIRTKPSARIDYIEIVDGDTLGKLDEIKGAVLIVLAIYIGRTRLIDNIMVVLQGKSSGELFKGACHSRESGNPVGQV